VQVPHQFNYARQLTVLKIQMIKTVDNNTLCCVW